MRPTTNNRYPKKETNVPGGYNIPYGTDPGRPTKEEKPQTSINRLLLKDQPNSSIQILATPYSVRTAGQTPYSLVASNNKVIGGSYKGEPNLSGAGVEGWNTSSESRFLYAYDSLKCTGTINYRYLPVLPSDTHRGCGFIDKMIAAVSDAVSQIGATVFEDKSAMHWYIKTDMPMGSAQPVNINTDPDGEPEYAYVNSSEVLYAVSIMYQTMLQTIAATFNANNTFRCFQKPIMQMSWERETSDINSLFGLLIKKSAFVSKWEALATTLINEFFDFEWMKQANMITSVVGRKSDSYMDPLMEMKLRYAHPTTFQIYNNLTDRICIFDISKYVSQYTSSLTGEDRTLSFFDLATNIQELMSIQNVLSYVRSGGVSILGARYAVNDDQMYFNEIVDCLTGLTRLMSRFKKTFEDYRAVMLVMRNVGLNNWITNLNLQVLTDKDNSAVYNKTLHDIIQMLFTGAQQVTYNTRTARWDSSTLFDCFKGIPLFDYFSGGCVFSLSTKDINNSGVPHASDYLPILFSLDTSASGVNACTVLSRDGDIRTIYAGELGVEDQNRNRTLARLNPIGRFAVPIRVPTVKTTTNPIRDSFLQFLIGRVFQYGCIDLNGTNAEYFLDNDLYAWYSFEIYNIDTSVQGYASSAGPFRSTLESLDMLGFNS